MRLIPKRLFIDIFWDNWTQPRIFQLIQMTGDISDREMQSAFNLGIGLVAIVSVKDIEKLMTLSHNFGEEPIILDEVI